MIAAAASSTVSNGDVIGLAAAGIGILYWAATKIERTDNLFEERLVRAPKLALYELFNISEQYVIDI